MDPFQEGLGLHIIHVSSLPALLNSGVIYTPAVHCVCVYVAIEVFLRSLQSHHSAVCSTLLQFSDLGLHPRRVFIEVLKGLLYKAWIFMVVKFPYSVSFPFLL